MTNHTNKKWGNPTIRYFAHLVRKSGFSLFGGMIGHIILFSIFFVSHLTFKTHIWVKGSQKINQFITKVSLYDFDFGFLLF